MKIQLPKTEYPVLRIVVSQGDESFRMSSASDCVDVDIDIELPAGFDEDGCKVECQFMSNSQEVIDTVVIKEPVLKKDESKKDESKKDESKKDESKKDESKKDESKKEVTTGPPIKIEDEADAKVTPKIGPKAQEVLRDSFKGKDKDED